MKYFALLALLAVTGCASVFGTRDPAVANRDALGSAQTIWVDAQRHILAYRARPACTTAAEFASGTAAGKPCRNPSTYAAMQSGDRAVVAAVNKAKLDLEQNPGANSTKVAIAAAADAAKSLLSQVKEAR